MRKKNKNSMKIVSKTEFTDEDLKEFDDWVNEDRWFAEHQNGEWENGENGIVLHVDAPDYVLQAVKEYNEEQEYIRRLDLETDNKAKNRMMILFDRTIRV